MSRVMIGLLAVLVAGPAFAFNEPVGGAAAPTGSARSSEQAGAPGGIGPAADCRCQRPKPQLTEEERAERKALRHERAAHRAALGLPARNARTRAPRPPCP